MNQYVSKIEKYIEKKTANVQVQKSGVLEEE